MRFKYHAKQKICLKGSSEINIELNYMPRGKELELMKQYISSKETMLAIAIIKSKLGYINQIARTYEKLAGNSVVYKDLVGIGVLSLIKALNAYESKLDVEFWKHIDTHVRSAIIKEIHRFNSTRRTRDVWQILSNITFLKTCLNCYRRCVY